MNINIIYNYIEKIKPYDIERFFYKQGIYLNKKEVPIIYNYLKKNYKTMLEVDTKIALNKIKEELDNTIYEKILLLYNKYQINIETFKKNIREY